MIPGLPSSATSCPGCNVVLPSGSSYCNRCGAPLPAPPKSKSNAWYYERRGERKGPVDLSEMEILIGQGEIVAATLVWCSGMAGWAVVNATSLNVYLKAPPPLAKVKSALIWWLAFAPVSGVVLQIVLASSLHVALSSIWWIGIILNSGLASWDNSILKRAGYRVGGIWAWLLVPVYMFRRSALVDQNYAYSILWVCSFLFSFVLDASYQAASALPR
jgi:hypothetical protein